jgi:HD superfamily phosphodiesterase
MKAEEHIRKAEEQWMKPAKEFITQLFSDNPLPSHDQHHHLRVWHYASKLVTETEKIAAEIPPGLPQKLLLASLFHDTGLLKSNQEDHGVFSRQVFNEFLETQKEDSSRYSDIAEAIQYHDDKSYLESGSLILDNRMQLLPALSIADDLDAFGNIGIFRYAEIYLLRGIPFEDLGLKIIANLSGRFRNFMMNCARYPELVREHTLRHSTIEGFFRNYNLQMRKIEEGKADPAVGPVGAVKEIYREILAGAPGISEACENVLSRNCDPFIISFIKDVKSETSIV